MRGSVLGQVTRTSAHTGETEGPDLKARLNMKIKQAPPEKSTRRDPTRVATLVQYGSVNWRSRLLAML
jgi:hypothetical protein